MTEAAQQITEGLRILANMIVKKFISETKTAQASNNLSLIRKPLEVQGEKLTLSVQEVARLLGVSKNGVYVLVHTGKISSLKFGRRILFPKRKLEEIIERSGL
nr:hypothetical protein DMOBY_13590 [Dehalococcoides mccartyi]